MGSIGGTEILVILLVVLLLFGAKRIPEFARGLGKGIREFKSATQEIKNEINVADDLNMNRIDTPRRPTQGSPQPRNSEQPANSVSDTSDSSIQSN
jgi:sec-independent protein translocase protein TatA